MDQDSFRKLLGTPGVSSGNGTSSRGSLLPPQGAKSKSKTKVVDPSQPAFKPRNVKKKGDSYRDRAAERRLGIDSDYAQVEALAEDFERRTVNEDRAAVEEQRQFLGGDIEHTVLVKGLDFSLLEQNKARVAAATEDDDTLEQAFLEASSEIPKKRTREDIVRELKNKRLKGDADDTPTGDTPAPAVSVDLKLEQAKKAGKFKPIGFKPIGAQQDKPKRKVKEKEKGSERKKKRKVESESSAPPPVPDITLQSTEGAPSKPKVDKPKLVPEPEPEPEPEHEPVDPDFDIFADAGEYVGIDLDDEDDDEETEVAEKEHLSDNETVNQITGPRQWVAIDDPGPSLSSAPGTSASLPVNSQSPPPIGEPIPEEGEEEQIMRLAPLASSALPSIKEFLAMDEAAEKDEKRRTKKDKRKAGGDKKLSAESKVDRDYQRLKTYTEKKASGSGKT